MLFPLMPCPGVLRMPAGCSRSTLIIRGSCVATPSPKRPTDASPKRAPKYLRLGFLLVQVVSQGPKSAPLADAVPNILQDASSNTGQNASFCSSVVCD